MLESSDVVEPGLGSGGRDFDSDDLAEGDLDSLPSDSAGCKSCTGGIGNGGIGNGRGGNCPGGASILVDFSETGIPCEGSMLVEPAGGVTDLLPSAPVVWTLGGFGGRGNGLDGVIMPARRKTLDSSREVLASVALEDLGSFCP